MSRRAITSPRRHAARGQSIAEMALLLPVVLILLLGAIDVSSVLSSQQHLENAVHLAALKLLRTPSLHASANLTSFIEGESGLWPVSAGSAYGIAGDGADQVVVTATYSYPLIVPGLRKLQTGSITNGFMAISVSAAGIAATSPPSLTVAAGTLKVIPPADGSAPSGLTLVCSLTQGGATVATKTPCTSSSPLQWTNPNPTPSATHPYTATLSQTNGVTSPASTPVSAP